MEWIRPTSSEPDVRVPRASSSGLSGRLFYIPLNHDGSSRWNEKSKLAIPETFGLYIPGPIVEKSMSEISTIPWEFVSPTLTTT